MTSRQTKLQQDTAFGLLRLLQVNPDLTQRQLAENLRVSVGAVNYCLKALMERGLVKMKNFTHSKNKFGYVYVLTPAGIRQKTQMTAQFLQRKLLEHQQLTLEIQALANEIKEGQDADSNPCGGGGLLRSRISSPGLI